MTCPCMGFTFWAAWGQESGKNEDVRPAKEVRTEGQLLLSTTSLQTFHKRLPPLLPSWFLSGPVVLPINNGGMGRVLSRSCSGPSTYSSAVVVGLLQDFN